MRMTSAHRFGSLCIALVLGFLTLFSGLSFSRAADDDVPGKIKDKKEKQVSALNEAVNDLSAYLADGGLAGKEDAPELAQDFIYPVYEDMLYRQLEVVSTLISLQEKIERFKSDDLRGEEARDALDNAKDRVADFDDLNAARHIYWEQKAVGQMPQVGPDQEFKDADSVATTAINEVNLVLLRPSRPGDVPRGDIVKDLIPTIVRQLFRFAFLAVLVAFVISGIYLIISFDEEARVTKAKHMIYYTLIGFAFIVMAFAMVKAVTDIDFFGFI